MRDDLKLAAYAVALGYTLHLDALGSARPLPVAAFEPHKGVPADGISFKRGAVTVWDTDRGWRVAKLEGDRFPKPQPSDFYRSLYHALNAGVALGGKLPAAADGPYSAPLAQAFREGARRWAALLPDDDRVTIEDLAPVREAEGGVEVQCWLYVADTDRDLMPGEEG